MKNTNIGILICQNYYKELETVIRSSDLNNIKISTFSPHCADLDKKDCETINKLYSDLEQSSKHVRIFAPDVCTNCKEKTDKDSIQEQIMSCTELFISRSFNNQLISDGCYILTPGWLLNWKQIVIKRWKFDNETAKIFFKDTAKEIVVLDTDVYSDYSKLITDFSEFVGLPYRIINIGLDFFQMKVEKVLNEIATKQILEDNKKLINEKNKKLADYAMLFDIIPKIATIRSEHHVIKSLTELLQMLLSPDEIVVAFLKSGKIYEFISTRDEIDYDKDEFEKMFDFEDIIHIEENHKNLKVKVAYQNDIFAYIAINNILFPQYINSYNQILSIILSYLGLFISNARQHNTIINAKNKIEENEVKLFESNKTKDLFFSIIAHDLKSPFFSMLNIARMLEEEFELFSIEEKKEYIGIINKGLKETYNLLENLLYWASSQKGTIHLKPKLLNLKLMLDSSVELFKNQANIKSIDLKSITPEEDITIYADQDMLSTILRNLISNAVKFTNKGGFIKVQSEIIKKNDQKYIQISVKDSGLGIPKNKQKMLFQINKDISTKGTNNESGTGLGLILCKDFIERHGGEIWFESKNNQGSEFIFTIPYDVTSNN